MYPVEIVLKVSKSGVNVSDSFTTDIKVSRRWITFGEYGSIRLVRPIDPRKIGRQRVRGSGILKYDF
jgi:hypothetical protein